MIAFVQTHPLRTAGTLTLCLLIAFVLLSQDLGALWSRTLLWIISTQRDLHRELAQAMQAVRQGSDGALWGMMLISFLTASSMPPVRDTARS